MDIKPPGINTSSGSESDSSSLSWSVDTRVISASSTCTDIPLLTSSQEETDTRIILYCDYSQENYHHIRVKSPATDVFFILLNYIGKMKHILPNGDRYSQQEATALMTLHAFSGCDTTSAFKGLGKIKPLKVLLRTPKYIPVLARLGETWYVPRDLYDELDSFTCAVYGKPHTKTVNDLRYSRIHQLCMANDQFKP